MWLWILNHGSTEWKCIACNGIMDRILPSSDKDIYMHDTARTNSEDIAVSVPVET